MLFYYACHGFSLKQVGQVLAQDVTEALELCGALVLQAEGKGPAQARIGSNN